MVRRILIRITYVGKERLIEAPTDLPIGRLAEIVGRAIAPTETDEEGLVRYELCVSGVPVAENERVGRVCALLQPGQALQLRIVRERTSPPTELGTAPKGEFYSATWILGGRAVAVAGEWGVYLWDLERQAWQAAPVVTLPTLQVAANETWLLCTFKRGGLAIWEYDEASQRWHGRTNIRLPGSVPITSVAMTTSIAAIGTESGSVYWFSVPDLELENEIQSKQDAPVRFLHWMDGQHCLRLNARGKFEIWRPHDVRPIFEESLTNSVRVVGAANVGVGSTNWTLLLCTEPMQWIWIALGGMHVMPAMLPPHSEPVSLAYAPRSRTMWVGFVEGTLQAWHFSEAGRSLVLRARYALGVSGLRQVLLSRDERWLVSIDEKNQVKVHAIQELREQ